ncbi:hypothetical protein [Paenibacillus prosopidis]|uniref:TraC-like domain-containing protein n=1 Tax=Paenibacillus prosopidis TaxID=630520 RepID=A0A368VLS3_9BACL|nr:hypothetical protein [Paenibacillus prosopidis]RCW41646.1 hypothetical protein DFP97_12282 [Paenibacillus prosopidis]
MIKKILNRGKEAQKQDQPKTPAQTHPVTGSSKSNVPSVQAWLPFYDVNMGFLWRRDNHLVTAVRVEPINLSLLSEKEQKRKVHMLFEVINGMECEWGITALQRPVDLDEYISNQEALRNQETHYMRRRILDSSIRNAANVASSGEAIELMFYILLTNPLSAKKQALDMQQLQNKAIELADNLSGAELESHVCDDQELRELEFLFLNPLQAAFERAPQSSGPYLPPRLSMEVNYG